MTGAGAYFLRIAQKDRIRLVGSRGWESVNGIGMVGSTTDATGSKSAGAQMREQTV
jgi:hypothetical protein